MPNTLNLPTKTRMVRGKQTFAKYRESLGGKLFVVRPSAWPEFEELTITVYNLTKTELDTYIAFFEANHGITITLIRTWNAGMSGSDCVDHDERIATWAGIIVSNSIEYSSDKWRAKCTGADNRLYTLSFQFQGNPTSIA